jgi:hypothetical protein
MAIDLDGLLGITSDGNVTTGNFFIGNGYYLTNVQAVSSYNDANVNALLASGSVPLVNVLDVETQALQTIDLTAYGNVTALSFIGDGSQLTGLPAGYTNANVTTLLASGNVTSNVVTTGNISGNNLSVTTNAVLGNIYSDNFFYANGTPFTSGSSGVVIGDQQITGDGGTSYTLSQPATTTSVMVALNGVTQYPTTAYTVSGNTITFASAVSNANVIDVRFFAASGGNSSIYGDANVAVFMPTYSGNLGTANTTPVTAIFTDGYYYANGAPFSGGGPATLPLANGASNFDIATANGNPTITSDGNTWTFGGATPEAIYWPDGSFQTTAFVGIATTAEAVSNVGNTTITIDPLGANVVWAFDTAGNLTLPDTAGILSAASISIEANSTPNTSGIYLNGDANANIYAHADVVINANTNGTSSTWTFDSIGTLTAPGDIVPAGDATQSLGSSTNQWKDLWLSGNTLYMTQVPISLTGANTLQVDGANVVTSDANGNVDLAGNVNAAGLTIVGNAIITGNANIQGTLTYNNTTNITTANLVIGLGNTQTGINVTGGGMIVGNTAEAQFLYNQPAQTWDSNLGIDAAGNITAPYFIGDGSQLTGLPAGYADSNVTTLLASGTVTSNVVTTGNISGNYIIGNGSLLTGIAASGNSITNGTSNVKIATANANVTMSVAGTPNVVTVTGNSLYVAGNIYDATGQIYGAAASFIKYTRTTNQTGVVANTAVICNVAEATFGNDITVNTTTGNVTLQAGINLSSTWWHWSY